MSAAGGARIGTRGPGETQLEVDRRRIVRRIHKLEAELREIAKHRADAAQGATARPAPSGRHRRLHERRQVDPAQPAHRRRGAGRGPPVRHPRRHHPPPRRCPGARRCCSPTPSASSASCPTSSSRRSSSTLDVADDADLLIHVVDAQRPRSGGPHRAVRDVLAEIGADEVPELLAFNKSDLAPGAAKRLADVREGSVALGAVTGEGVDDLLRDDRRPPSGADDGGGDGDSVRPRRRAGGGPPRGRGAARIGGRDGMHIRGRFDDATLSRFREFVVT